MPQADRRRNSFSEKISTDYSGDKCFIQNKFLWFWFHKTQSLLRAVNKSELLRQSRRYVVTTHAPCHSQDALQRQQYVWSSHMQYVPSNRTVCSASILLSRLLLWRCYHSHVTDRTKITHEAPKSNCRERWQIWIEWIY